MNFASSNWFFLLLCLIAYFSPCIDIFVIASPFYCYIFESFVHIVSWVSRTLSLLVPVLSPSSSHLSPLSVLSLFSTFPFFLWKTACLFSGANACFPAVFQKKGGATEERCSPLFLLLSSSLSLSLLLSAAIKGERTGYLELSSSSPVSQINIQIFTQLLVLFFLPRD